MYIWPTYLEIRRTKNSGVGANKQQKSTFK